MKTITPVELQHLLAAQPSAPVIDVRTPVEFAEVHVPQARNIPLDRTEAGSLAGCRKTSRFICFAAAASAPRRRRRNLPAKDLPQPVVVDGGTARLDRSQPAGDARPDQGHQPRTPGAHCGGFAGFDRRDCSAGLCIAVSLACRRLSARDWFLPASRIFAAWACCSPKCPGTTGRRIEFMTTPSLDKEPSLHVPQREARRDAVWMGELVEETVPELLRSYQRAGGLNNRDAHNMPSKRAVGQICEDLLQFLFPGFHDDRRGASWFAR